MTQDQVAVPTPEETLRFGGLAGPETSETDVDVMRSCCGCSCHVCENGHSGGEHASECRDRIEADFDEDWGHEDCPGCEECETYNCEFCGQQGVEDEWNHEHECPRRDFIWMKGICCGAETLTDVEQALRGVADYLAEKLTQGWELVQPEDNGHIYIGKKLAEGETFTPETTAQTTGIPADA
jgi:hypothetical protein